MIDWTTQNVDPTPTEVIDVTALRDDVTFVAVKGAPISAVEVDATWRALQDIGLALTLTSGTAATIVQFLGVKRDDVIFLRVDTATPSDVFVLESNANIVLNEASHAIIDGDIVYPLYCVEDGIVHSGVKV